jgi:hypothetical protein
MDVPLNRDFILPLSQDLTKTLGRLHEIFMPLSHLIPKL